MEQNDRAHNVEEIVRKLLEAAENCCGGKSVCTDAVALIKTQAAEIAEYQKFGEPNNVYGMLKYYAAEVKRLTAENDELVVKMVASQQETRAAVEALRLSIANHSVDERMIARLIKHYLEEASGHLEAGEGDR